MGLDDMANSFDIQQKQFADKLLEIFKNLKSNHFNRCSAAYCLGEMRVAEVSETLAVAVTLKFVLSSIGFTKHSRG
jgi:hypothetical protein